MKLIAMFLFAITPVLHCKKTQVQQRPNGPMMTVWSALDGKRCGEMYSDNDMQMVGAPPTQRMSRVFVWYGNPYSVFNGKKNFTTKGDAEKYVETYCSSN